MDHNLHMRLSAAGARTILSRIHSDRILACSEALVYLRRDEEVEASLPYVALYLGPTVKAKCFLRTMCVVTHTRHLEARENTVPYTPGPFARTEGRHLGHALIGITHIVTLSAIQLGHANTQKVDTPAWYSLVLHTSESPALHTWPMYM